MRESHNYLKKTIQWRERASIYGSVEVTFFFVRINQLFKDTVDKIHDLNRFRFQMTKL